MCKGCNRIIDIDYLFFRRMYVMKCLNIFNFTKSLVLYI